ncbi:hypothetical protein [Planctomicrobium piriforme]|uniref:Uncharacterized protein n=1 Tax=Planctomicrobium piriforme TaxID=1576369 RepID=A0A1I3PBA8_9PLAN|nr:hypothetical protein [Planctomicrobium piriforme]SFJ18742.1 hypothetical protein SAMN05421753_11695 [Planctomicrobium piriforme]
MTNIPASEQPAQGLTPAAWRYLIVDQGLIAIGVNFLINYLIARSAFAELKVVPLHGPLSIAEDIAATCFFLPFIACLIVSHLTGFEIRKGKFPALPPFRFARYLGEYLSQSIFPRALMFGILGRFLVAPVAIAAVEASGVQSLPLSTFLIFKGAFASALGIVACPLFAWIAMHQAKPAPK